MKEANCMLFRMIILIIIMMNLFKGDVLMGRKRDGSRGTEFMQPPGCCRRSVGVGNAHRDESMRGNE